MRLALLVGLAVLLPSLARAETRYPPKIPNGSNLQCVACHDLAFGGRGWNAFGDALFIANGGTAEAPGTLPGGDAGRDECEEEACEPNLEFWSEAFCQADSDGDGASNGLELGDPDCEWVEGDADPDVEISNPGDPEDTVAGDGGAAEGEGEGEGKRAPPPFEGGCSGGNNASPNGLIPPAIALLALVGLTRRRRI